MEDWKHAIIDSSRKIGYYTRELLATEIGTSSWLRGVILPLSLSVPSAYLSTLLMARLKIFTPQDFHASRLSRLKTPTLLLNPYSQISLSKTSSQTPVFDLQREYAMLKALWTLQPFSPPPPAKKPI